MELRIGSLFSGTGALDQAVMKAISDEFGLTAVLTWYSDIKPAAVALHEHWHPTVPNIGHLVHAFPAIGPLPEEITLPHYGRTGDPRGTQAMYDRYCQGLSLAQVGAEFGVTRQTVFKRFERAGLSMRPKPPLGPSVRYGGRTYALDESCGYYRCTSGNRERLHRVVWRDANGPIPDGHDIHHRDHNKANNTLDNLECLSKADHARLHGEEVVPMSSLSVDVVTAGWP